MRYGFILVLFGAFGALCAAAGGGVVYLLSNKERFTVSPTATPMSAQIALQPQNLCEPLSPGIRVENIPAGAQRMAVRILDLNYSFDHGGGVVAAPPNGVISEGALSNYIGLCPGDTDNSYRFRIDALDADNRIVGIAEVTLPCCSAVRGQ